MAFGSSGQSSPLSDINVTPLVDVMLVLLVIFMITAPMIQTGVRVDLPRARAAVMEREASKLVLTVDRDRRVYLGDAEVPRARLDEALRTNERLQREKELYIQADENIPYGFVVRIMAAAQQAGVERIGMVTNPLATGTQ